MRSACITNNYSLGFAWTQGKSYQSCLHASCMRWARIRNNNSLGSAWTQGKWYQSSLHASCMRWARIRHNTYLGFAWTQGNWHQTCLHIVANETHPTLEAYQASHTPRRIRHYVYTYIAEACAERDVPHSSWYIGIYKHNCSLSNNYIFNCDWHWLIIRKDKDDTPMLCMNTRSLLYECQHFCFCSCKATHWICTHKKTY
jgi:hypothetical protein